MKRKRAFSNLQVNTVCAVLLLFSPSFFLLLLILLRIAGLIGNSIFIEILQIRSNTFLYTISPFSPRLCEDALGAGHVGAAGLDGNGGAQGHGDGLEGRLGSVVVVLAVEALDVQAEPCLLRKRVEDMRDHLAAQRANLLALQAQVHNSKRPRRDVHHGARQRLVQRAVRVPVARDPAPLAQRLVKRPWFLEETKR